MNEKDDVRLDDILQQAQHTVPSVEKPAASEDAVDAILASLGLGVGTKRADVVRPMLAGAQTDQAAQGTIGGAPARPVIGYRQTQPAPRRAATLPPPHAQPARIITAPVTVPVVEHETSTLELPSIKAFSEAQERRRAAIERAATEAALRRAAEAQNRNPYAMPGMSMHTDNLGVEVDDRFRAFFATSAQEESAPAKAEKAVKEDLPRKKDRGRKRKARMQEMLDSVTRDADERFLTGEFDVPMPRGEAKKSKTNAPEKNVPGQQTLFDLPQLQPLPPIAWEAVGDTGTPAPPPAKPSVPPRPLSQAAAHSSVFPPASGTASGAAAQGADRTAAPAGVTQEAAVPRAAPSAPTSVQPAQMAQPGKKEPLFSPPPPAQKKTVAPGQKVFSDTFQLNRFDVPVQQPAPIPWNTIDLPEISLDSTGEMPISPASTPFTAPADASMGQTRAVPTEYREMLVDLPLTGTTDVTGDLLPVYEVGAEDERFDDEADYNHLSDAPAVHATLKRMRLSRILRTCVMGLLTLILLWLNLSAHYGLAPLLPALDPVQKPAIFLAVNLILVLMGGAICLTTLGAGLVGLVGRPSVDTLPALAVVISAVQLCAYMFKPEAFKPASVALTAPLALLLLMFNTLGKWLHSITVSKNFALASAGYDHSAAFLVPGRELTRAVCHGLSVPDPLLLVSRPTELVKGFMRQSFSAHSSDIAARKLSYLLLLGGALCGALGGFITKDICTGISGAAATVCLAVPLASTLVYAVPALLLQKAAGKVGAVVPGPSAMQNLGLCNTVLLDAKDLFPAASVRFHGLQTFEKQRVDLAILYAASLLYEKCETLRDVFMALIDNKKDILYKVDGLQNETGYGYAGWIDRHQVMVGNRVMMRRHNINVPSRDYEEKYTRGGERSIIYLAVGGRLFGMFVISYVRNASAKHTLDILADSGISVLLQSDDFNVTSELLMATYRVSPSFVKVLSQPERNMLSGQTEYMSESEGYMTHTGTCESFVGGLQATATAVAGESLAGVVQMVALLFTLALCLVLSFTLGVENLGLVPMILYQLAWCAVTVLMPLLKRK